MPAGGTSGSTPAILHFNNSPCNPSLGTGQATAATQQPNVVNSATIKFGC
jgi:hypothetical protein